jgi:cytochrome b561
MTYGTLPPGGYPATSKWLHWLVALSVLIAVPVGILLPYLPPNTPAQTGFYNMHKSLGVLILILMILRIINRLARGAPAPEPGLERWKRAASSAVHGLLYVLLIVQPLFGYWANSAYGATTPFFGMTEIPPMVDKSEGLAKQLFAIHRWIGITIAVVAVAHIAAALQHYFIDKDSVLQRMLPRALGWR